MCSSHQSAGSVLLERQGAMIVAMVSMRVMQVPSNEIIGMIPMRNGFLSLVVASAGHWSTACWVERAFGNDVFLVAACLGGV